MNDRPAEAADQQAAGIPPSSLPWGQIPRFDPATTDLRVYSQKLEFLHQIWPREHLEHLAPRAALLIEGAAFQKVARIEAAKLRTPDGVQILIEALGGQWGRTSSEDTYDLFERALYMTSQKPDETNDSYLTRHDIVFEDLLSKKISLADIRAYVLVRQSNLSSEDRKRIIVDNQGQLTYDQARKSMRLLGSRFFQDLQGNRNNQGKKTYEAYQMDELDEQSNSAFVQEADTGELDEEQAFQMLADQGDEDAIFIADFEDQIVDAIQDHPGLSQCFVSYQEARARVRERARARGFWPVKGKSKGKGSKKSKPSWGTSSSSSSWSAGRRRSLADRIANSTCRACGQPGHWKRECPNRSDMKKNETVNVTDEIHLGIDDKEQIIQEVTDELPPNAVPWTQVGNQGQNSCHGQGQCWECHVCVETPMNQMVHGILHGKLVNCCRKHGIEKVVNRKHESAAHERASFTQGRNPPEISAPSIMKESPATIFQVEEACHEAIIDTGASRAVIGSERLAKLVEACCLGDSLKTAPSNVNFRFGNSGMLQSSHAVFFPRKIGGWIRVEVVPGSTPFLLSNSVLRALRAVVDVEAKQVWFKGTETSIPLKTCRKNLMSVDFGQILNLSMNHSVGHQHEIHLVGDQEKHEDMVEHFDRGVKTVYETKSQNDSTMVQGQGEPNPTRQQGICGSCEGVQVRRNMTHGDVGDGLRPTCVYAVSTSPQVPSIQQVQLEPELCHELETTGSASDLRRGSEAQYTPVVFRCGVIGNSASTRNQHSERMGSVADSLGQICEQDLRRGPCRSGVCTTNVESQSRLGLGSQFSDVLQSQEPNDKCIRPQAARHGDQCGSQSIDGGDHEGRGLEERREQGQSRASLNECSKVSSGSQESGSSEHQRLDQNRGRCEAISRIKSVYKEGKCEHTVRQHEDRTEPGTGSSPSHPDSHSGTRVGQGDKGSRRQDRLNDELEQLAKYIQSDEPICPLTKVQEEMLHMAIQEKIHEVECGLFSMTSKSDKSHVRVSSGQGKFGKGKTNQSRPLDLLEVYCGPSSQLTFHVNKMGGRAMRFSYNDGDLKTTEGIQKLWLWIYMYEPRHIWLAPECRLYGKFSTLNMSQSISAYDRIMNERHRNKIHLQLCNDIFVHQVSHRRHVHLEQPAESCMFGQPELQEMIAGTYETKFDMCQVGKLQLPHTGKFLRKRTTIRTTSGYIHNHVHQQFCSKNHEHEPIQGSFNHQGQRQNVSAYAAAYTSMFGSRFARLILEECEVKESPCVFEVFVSHSEHERPGITPDDAQCPKRQRHSIKGPPRESDIPSTESGYRKAPTWESLVKQCSSVVPRVGNFSIRPGDQMFGDFQMMVPELQIKLIVLCRGTDRYRVPGALTNGEHMPWRKTVIIDRSSGAVIDKGPPENWTSLTRLQQIRKSGPARLSITLFGEKPSESSGAPQVLDQGVLGAGVGEDQEMGEEKVISEGWPPRIAPKSGPNFESLEPGQKADLRRLHSNLGHPHPGKLAKLLSEQGADEAVVKAARDYQCDACVESQPGPKLSHPSSLHVPRDFNDCVGCDGAYWSNQQGLKFHFMHFIDEATLYHAGVPSGRSTEEQIQVFENTWLNWAGPCKILYLDPAGEYINDQWHDFAQREGIKLSVAAGESHWQIGRAESHGRIIKQMLTAMDVEEPISNFDQFRKCLRQAFAAKNSLSNVNGYSPEQALLGKSCAIPASLTGDSGAASHSLADSETPEGILFRESLRRRECARKAFLTADNHHALRRAILRRPRKEISQYQAGDWVLYWRRQKGNIKGDRGRWHGPGQVIATEYPKVVWVSHGGYLVRASPQQLRPASTREHLGLPRDVSGKIVDEVVKTSCKNYVQLDQYPDEEARLPDSPMGNSAGGSNSSNADGSQPEGEIFPSVAPSSVSPCPSILDDTPESPDRQIDFNTPVETPVPNDGDDVLFGDDCQVDPGEEGFWEIGIDCPPIGVAESVMCCESPEILEWVCLATGARKQRVEVQWKNLGESEKKLFEKAKEKEISAWVSHGTVQRVARGTLRDDQIMRCRWILTWKPPAPGTSEKRPKARLVVLGFEDPQISSISADAPTLSKDGKQLILQQVASRGWQLINFDISTAFLKGAGDGRKLGLHAPKELQKAIGMEPGDQCSLIGGAYGRADAPILWYKTIRKTLEELGFVAAPFDGCVFSLITAGPNGQPKVRGCLGLHVDDGIGGVMNIFGKSLNGCERSLILEPTMRGSLNSVE